MRAVTRSPSTSAAPPPGPRSTSAPPTDTSGGLVEAGFAHWSPTGELVFGDPSIPTTTTSPTDSTPTTSSPSFTGTMTRAAHQSTIFRSVVDSPQVDEPLPSSGSEHEATPFPTMFTTNSIAREADDSGSPATSGAAAASTAAPTAAAAGPGGAAAPPSDLDELARRLYPRLRAHLKADLRTERERTGGVATRR